MRRMRTVRAEQWRVTALATMETARHLREREDFRSCVSRAYYAAYQAGTSICLEHGDASNFPHGRNNPSHEQLPDLLFNNNGYTMVTRRTLRKILRELRVLREDSDYRMGRTIDAASARSALLMATTLFRRLGIE